MTIRKTLAALLCVFLLAGMMPPVAHAAEAEPPAAQMTQVNPMVANLPAAVVQPPAAERNDGETVTADVFHPTKAAAQTQLLEEMMARKTTIIIGVTADIYSQSLVYSLPDTVHGHIGVPKAGDYLLYHWYSWAATIYRSDKGYTIVYDMTYVSTAEEEAQVDAAVDALLTELDLWNASDYDKIKGVYDWICTNVTYDYDGLAAQNSLQIYTAYAALVKRTSVCQGYASLFYRMMLELGVDCRVITGTVDGGAHAWNIVKLDGVYYNVDATFDAAYLQGDVGYCYFLVSDANFVDHVADLEFTSDAFRAAYPKAEADYDDSNGYAIVGFCGAQGENLVWAMKNGILFIFGDGAMADYPASNAPWKSFRDYIVGIYVEEGVTYIGKHAFTELRQVTDAYLSGSVETIGQYAFCNCINLQHVELPQGLTTIQLHAFAGCSKLEDVTLPDTLTTLEQHAFYSTRIRNIVVPDGITELSDSVFSSSSLESIILPETLTTIGDSAFFQCSRLKTIHIPDSVTSIGSGAFSYSGLTEIKIPDGVTALNSTVFANCADLKHLTLGSGVASIDASALSGCPALETYTVSADNAVYADLDGVLATKDLTTLLDYPEGRTAESYTVPESVTTIGRSAFERSKLVSLILTPQVQTIEPLAFTESRNLTALTIPEGVTKLREFSLSHCSSLTEVTLPESLTWIGENALAYTGLTELVIPANVSYLGKGFAYYSPVSMIEFRGNAPAFHESAFWGVEATARYPASNESWTDEVKQNYLGTITWEATCDAHVYESVVTPPTCTEGGYTTHTCTGCGRQIVDTHTDPTGHIYDNDADMFCNACGHDRTPILTTPMYRLYNPNSGEHFYTGSTEERDMLADAGWAYEGVAWNAPITSGDPVYRLYNPNSGDHHYTMSADERDWLVSLGWNYEGVAWNSATTDDVPQFRLYNPNADCGSHHYTSSTEERDYLVSLGWHYEGIGWYGTLK